MRLPVAAHGVELTGALLCLHDALRCPQRRLVTIIRRVAFRQLTKKRTGGKRPFADIQDLRFKGGMHTLEALFQRFAKRSHARWWIGARPVVRDGQVAKAIARQVGLPTSADDPFANSGMIAIDWACAAHVLAVAGTTSLAYDKWSPSAGALKDAKAALKNLSGNATFVSNGRWNAKENWWNPLTSATFDCGVIGFDNQNAFIFWVEEED